MNHVEMPDAIEGPLGARRGRPCTRSRVVYASVTLVNPRAMTTRLQNAMLARTEVPDRAKLPFDAMRYSGRGPVKDAGVLDLTDRLKSEVYRDRLVEARLSLWSTRGHGLALPHDLRPGDAQRCSISAAAG